MQRRLSQRKVCRTERRQLCLGHFGLASSLVLRIVSPLLLTLL